MARDRTSRAMSDIIGKRLDARGTCPLRPGPRSSRWPAPASRARARAGRRAAWRTSVSITPALRQARSVTFRVAVPVPLVDIHRSMWRSSGTAWCITAAVLALLLVGLSAAPAARAATGRRVALIIGCNEYRHTRVLRNCVTQHLDPRRMSKQPVRPRAPRHHDARTGSDAGRRRLAHRLRGGCRPVRRRQRRRAERPLYAGAAPAHQDPRHPHRGGVQADAHRGEAEVGQEAGPGGVLEARTEHRPPGRPRREPGRRGPFRSSKPGGLLRALCWSRPLRPHAGMSPFQSPGRRRGIQELAGRDHARSARAGAVAGGRARNRSRGPGPAAVARRTGSPGSSSWSTR